MFTLNKYTRWYNNIISAAQRRGLTSRAAAKKAIGYTEMHHIIPKSLGGGEEIENKVFLTAKEHFVCHHLLTKMVIGNDAHKMVYACKQMMHGANSEQQRYRITPKAYEALKLNLNAALVGRTYSTVSKEKMKQSAILRCQKESAEIKARRAKQLSALNRSRKGVKKPSQCGDKNPFAKKSVQAQLAQTNLEKYGYANPALVPFRC